MTAEEKIAIGTLALGSLALLWFATRPKTSATSESVSQTDSNSDPGSGGSPPVYSDPPSKGSGYSNPPNRVGTGEPCAGDEDCLSGKCDIPVSQCL